ncbi:MAG TPA: NUDIX hydrolase [Candidatus Limnocylindrales bacterium]|nr:NUDIX hydrolase [Candidatus Limnocylindrales bacterium]
MAKVLHDSETPAQGQQVISVCAFIHHDFGGVTKVFLPKRADTKKFLPGFYELPGGHVDYGEDIVAGLKREVMEEFGMGINIGDPFAAFTYLNTVKGSHSIEVIYFATFADPLDHISLQPEDHSEYKWLAKDEVIQYRGKMTPEGQAVHENGEQDAEYQTILKGFTLLEGQPVRFT